MISVDQALAQLFALVQPMPAEDVPLLKAAGRVLARDVAATRDQPPFAASAMDGYAVAAGDVAPGAAFQVVGEAAAGRALDVIIGKGQAARIFTGAPMPMGTNRVVIQEDVQRVGDTITLNVNLDTATYVRAQGLDFHIGQAVTAPRQISSADVALFAAMNIPKVPVARSPVVAIIATGDELVQPGEIPGPDQIIASNSYGLAALLRQHGAVVRMLPIARDTLPALELVLGLAQGADLIISIGGASEGDHDLVGQAAANMGLERAFYKIAMRPGKPLMAGRIGDAMMIGLPGNPVSAMVCGHIFVLPMLRAMLGLPAAAAPRVMLPLATALPANGPRAHYMRGIAADGQVTAFERQDSVLLSGLSQANCLVVHAPHAAAMPIGAPVPVVLL